VECKLSAMTKKSGEADAIVTNATGISTEINIDGHVIMLYIHIHQGLTISCVILHLILKLRFLLTVTVRVKVRVSVSVFQTFM